MHLYFQNMHIWFNTSKKTNKQKITRMVHSSLHGGHEDGQDLEILQNKSVPHLMLPTESCVIFTPDHIVRLLP